MSGGVGRKTCFLLCLANSRLPVNVENIRIQKALSAPFFVEVGWSWVLFPASNHPPESTMSALQSSPYIRALARLRVGSTCEKPMALTWIERKS